MSWFRNHQRALLRMALMLWVLAFAVAVSHGCLSYLAHDPLVAHPEASASAHDRSHQLHASGCLQFCEDGASALKLSPGQLSFDQVLWALLITLPVLLLPAASRPRFAARAIHLPGPPRPPARLSFVRFND
ncbi:hypothetical membrane protein [Pseudomonas knackmussii B13]|uniref:Hypothetical membrane protein n=1 Tax=Pseudomonas knackmussii (strain DSM 6978 / CCUG 54928 / LMG 23759 / B13) TaxID=1301098 RepID=A0A024HJH2_PSEKB|nr:hypothetical protein [Pseudomonas knackmussii]CDF84657.1 hypothetical membrane protein [Pseudomonas knackmussii B13]